MKGAEGIADGQPRPSTSAQASRTACLHGIDRRDLHGLARSGGLRRQIRKDLRGQPISTPAFRDFECYIYGNEARGLPHDALAAMNAAPFTIEGTGAIESLNVATTVNICQYELARGACS